LLAHTVQSQTIVTSFSQLESRFLHGEGILHRDLKSLNVLVDEAWRCKVADFDQSRVEADTLTATVGTVLWSAPEVLRGQGDYGKEADVYSFGIVMFECWTREAPFQHPGAPKRFNVRQHIMQGGRPVCPVGVGDPPTKYGELMHWCWEEEMARRPTLEEVVGMLESIALKGDANMQRGGNTLSDPNGASQEPGPPRQDMRSVRPQSGSLLGFLKRLSLGPTGTKEGLDQPLLPLTTSE